MNKASVVFFSLIGVGLFLETAIPFYLASYGFYNGFPILTDLSGLWLFLGFALIGTGILYYVFERKAIIKSNYRRAAHSQDKS